MNYSTELTKCSYDDDRTSQCTCFSAMINASENEPFTLRFPQYLLPVTSGVLTECECQGNTPTMYIIICGISGG